MKNNRIFKYVKFLLLTFFFAIIYQNCTSNRNQNISNTTNTLSTPYDRKLYHHWIDQDKNCLDTRSEILKLRSLSTVKMNHKGCKVLYGKWNDYYFNEILTEAKQIDIDHLIPLHHAHLSGADKWDFQTRENFANDDENLVITHKSYNRQKGKKTIAQWLPVDIHYACKYIQDWIKIKNKYNLSMNTDELKTIELIKPKCLK